MKCVNHPEINAAGTCSKCGSGVCPECKLELAGNTYCQVCADVYSQLQPEAILLACVNALNIDGVTVCYKCGRRISDDRKQELHNRTFCQTCAHEMIRDEANVALFLAEMARRKTGTPHVPRKKRAKSVPYTFILPFLPINPLIIIVGEILHLLFRFTRRFSSSNREQEPE